MNFVGFTGPGDQELSKASALDRTVNYYCEWPQVPGQQKTGPKLYPRPGAASFSPNPPNVVGAPRGKLSFNGLAYGVNGNQFYFLAADGGQQTRGIVVDDGKPARLVANSSDTSGGNGQVAIASGGELYIYTPSGLFVHIPNDGINFFGAADVDFMDGYFLVVIPNSSKFQFSAQNNGVDYIGPDGQLVKAWTLDNVGDLLGQADHIRSIIVDKEYFYLHGDLRTEVWYNSGNALFPFSIESGAFIEEGIGAPAGKCKTARGVFWLAASDRGFGYAVRTEGLSTRNITPEWVATRWQNKDPLRGTVYSTLADCITYAWEWNGHTLVRFIFPAADASWDYDVTESDRVGFDVWTECTFTDVNGIEHACIERDHCVAYGKHIIGSGGAEGSPGALYQLDQQAYYDCDDPGNSFLGFPITRRRTVRLPYNDGKYQFLDRIEFFLEPGVGTATGQGVDPQMLLRISHDGGRTFGTESSIPIGQQGQYTMRALANRLGKYRDGAIDCVITDPVFAALIGAEHYIRAGVS